MTPSSIHPSTDVGNIFFNSSKTLFFLKWNQCQETPFNVKGGGGQDFTFYLIALWCFLSVILGESRTLSDDMSWGEFIELRDLGSSQEPVDLSRLPCSPPRLERTNALRISPGKVPDLLSRVGIIRVLSSAHDPQITEEKGEGHNFQPSSQAQPTWCDLCGDFIWGLYKHSLRCTSE